MTKRLNKFLEENKINNKLLRDYLDYGLIGFSIVLGSYLKWGMQDIVVFAIVIWLILRPISSQLLNKIALYLVAIVPLLVIIRRYEMAEKFAILSFFALTLIIIMKLAENNRGNSTQVR